jgi:hypothetical protein
VAALGFSLPAGLKFTNSNSGRYKVSVVYMRSSTVWLLSACTDITDMTGQTICSECCSTIINSHIIMNENYHVSVS